MSELAGSRHWENYMISSGKGYYPEAVLSRLTLKQGLKDLMAEVGMDETPFRKRWYEQKFVELSPADLEPVEKWKGLTALLGLVHHRFSSVKFTIPPEWVDGYPFAKKEYTLGMTREFSEFSLQSSDWNQKFHEPERVYFNPGKPNPWLTRVELADEFAGLYFDRAREIIAAIGKASTAEETLKQHRQLREHIDEASWYDSMRMLDKIRLALPAFSAEVAESTDPAVRFAVTALTEICTFKAMSSRDVAKILLNSYFEKLKDISKAAESKRLVELIAFEVNEILDAQDAVAGGGK